MQVFSMHGSGYFFKGYDFEEMFCFQGGIDPYFRLFVNSVIISMNILSFGGWGIPEFRICFHYDLPSRSRHVEYKYNFKNLNVQIKCLVLKKNTAKCIVMFAQFVQCTLCGSLLSNIFI